MAQDLSQSRASVRLATSHSNSIVHAIPGYPASSPGRPFVTQIPTSCDTVIQPAVSSSGSLYGLLLQGLLRERVRGAQHLERWLGGPLEGLGSSRCSRRA